MQRHQRRKRHEKRLNNLIDLAADSGDKALLAKIRELEAQLTNLREQRAAWTERKALKESLLSFDERDLRDILAATALRLRGDGEQAIELLGYPNGPQLKPDELRRVLMALVERIELDPKTREFTIRYRIPVTGVKVASPRQTAAKPAIRFVRRLYLRGFRRRSVPGLPWSSG